jgi:hypothetical protein
MNLFCSNCGKPLGEVTHIFNDLLLCEDCYTKLGATGPSARKAPSTTVYLGQHNDSDRETATPFTPGDSDSASAAQPEAGQRCVFPSLSQSPESVDALFRRMYSFSPDEKVIWSRQLKQGSSTGTRLS